MSREVFGADSMNCIACDDRFAPLYLVQYYGVVDDAAFEQYLSWLQITIDAPSPSVLICDARRSGMTPHAQRKRQAMWLQQMHAKRASKSLGTVFVFDRAFLRLILSSVLLLAPMPSSYEIVANLEEAERWAQERFRQAGLPPPPRLPKTL